MATTMLRIRTMPQNQTNRDQLSFWEHLDELRGSIIRILIVVMVFGLTAFVFKDILFDFLLAPKHNSFISYRILNSLSDGQFGVFSINLINTGLAQQFMVHLKAAFAIGFLCATPYILFVLFKFVSPALYASERQLSMRLVVAGYFMFMIGAALSYFLIFPLTFRFLGTYQVSTDVPNLITLESYMGTLLMLSLMMGAMFELPVLSWLLSAAGILNADFMRRYRRHAIVAILTASAVITPTADVFTLMIVSLPIYLLYEASIVIVARTAKRRG